MREFLEQHVPTVYRFALRLTRDQHTAEELTQETMLRALKHHGKLAELETARPLLLRITMNLWRDELRRRSVRRTAGRGDHRAVGTQPADELSRREDADDALVALDRLPGRQQQVLYLSACEDLSISDIASVLGISTGAVRSSLSLARQEMRRLLDPALLRECERPEGGAKHG